MKEGVQGRVGREDFFYDAQHRGELVRGGGRGGGGGGGGGGFWLHIVAVISSIKKESNFIAPLHLDER